MSEIFNSLKKYNYWDETPFDFGFKRIAYINKIKKYIGNNLIKIIIGQRRTGKSFIVRQIIQALIEKNINRQNIFYLNKEIVNFDSIQSFKDLKGIIDQYKQTLKVQGKVYILLDEVQEIEEWEKIVNSLSQDYKDNYEVFITGSNSTLLSGELATLLSGRYITFEIQPFSFEEYTSYFNLNKNKQNYLNYLQISGLPELLKLEEEEIRLHYISSLLNTILLKDIVKRYKIKDIALLEKLFKFLTDNIGNLFSTNSIVAYLNSNKVKTNHETISNYIKYLLESFLLFEVDRYDIKGKEILASTKKYYLNDLGFKNYLSSSFDKGFSKHLENLVYKFFRMKGYTIYIGKISDLEVDFIVENTKEKIYVQVAYSLDSEKVINRELKSLQKITDSYKKIIVTLDDLEFGNKDGIQHVRAWELDRIF